MKEFKFKTSINCKHCQALVAPHMEKLSGVQDWTVDLNDPDRTLIVHTESTTQEAIIRAVRDAGFEITIV